MSKCNVGYLLPRTGILLSLYFALCLFANPVSAATTTTVNLNSSSNPSVFGESITFTATIIPSSGSNPTGTVTFFDGATSLSVQTVNNSQASITIPSAAPAIAALSVGSHNITASYSGDATFAASSNNLTQTVNAAGITITLTSSANPSIQNANVTFTAVVKANAPSAAVPSGSVSFLDGVATIGSANLTVGANSATATFTTNTLAVGSHSITASYATNTNFTGNTSSPALNQVVHFATSTALVSDITTSTFGQTVNLTATVSSAGAGFTGSVQFFDGATSLGTGVISGNTAMLPFKGLGAGSHSVTATYSGDANFDTSTSPPVSITVQQDPTTVSSVSSSASTSEFGQPVTFSATVFSTAPGSGVPTGTLQFNDNGAAIGGVVNLVNGVATLMNFAALTVGNHQITAAYLGSTDYLNSTSAPFAQTVNKSQSKVVFVPAIFPPNQFYGQNLVIGALVSPAGNGAGMPSGTVSYFDNGAFIGSGAVNAATGAASFSISTLPVGTNSIQLVYSGDNNFLTSSSGTADPNIQPAVTTTTVTTSNPNSQFNQAVTFTATIAFGNGTGSPMGKVQFQKSQGGPTTNLGAPVTVVNAQAQLVVSNLPVGDYQISAMYTDTVDVNFTNSTSAAIAQMVRNPTTVSLNSNGSSNPSKIGESVTFNANVFTFGLGNPTGNVNFFDGLNLLGSVTPTGSTASLAVTTLSLGSHNITAVFAGDNIFQTSTSAILGQTVQQADTVTTLAQTAGGSPSVYGESITISVTVAANSPGGGIPQGNVILKEGANPVPGLSQQALNGAGVAMFSLATLGTASHSITAVYTGNTNYLGSSSASPLLHVVQRASVTLSLTSSFTSAAPPNQSVAGEPVDFTATVQPNVPSGGGTAPAGTMIFTVDGTDQSVVLTNGTATIFRSDLSVAGSPHTVTATFPVTTDYNATGPSAAITHTVVKAATNVALTASPSPALLGQTVMLTAIVNINAPGGGTPTGTVAFDDNGTPLGTTALSGTAPYTATLSVSTLTAGTHPINATYSGDGSFLTSTFSTSEVILVNPTVTLAAAPPSPSVVGQQVTFTATVNTGALGSVTFKDGANTLGSVPLNGGNPNTASFPTTQLTQGLHSIQAFYSGDNITYAPGSSTASPYTVSTSTTTTVINANPLNSVFGQAVTFTATVSPVAPGAGTPAGHVDFKEGAVLLSQVTLQGGIANLTITTLAVGSHNIDAVYTTSDTNFSNSTSAAPVSVTVAKAATATVVTSSAPTSVFGQPVTFSAGATVTAPGASNSVTGTVTFTVGANPPSAPIALVNGTATLLPAISNLPVGTTPIKADYSGDNNLLASTTTFTQTVTKDITTTTVTSTPNPSTAGGPVTFTITVAPNAPGQSSPGGTVALFDNGNAIPGANALVVTNGVATFTTATLTGGVVHTILASYSGDVNNGPGNSSPYSQQVHDTTTTTVVSSLNPSVSGQSVTFTATVTPSGAGTPTGSVTFFDGAISLGSGVLAGTPAKTTLTVALNGGNHSITAVYAGDPTFNASTSAVLAQTVNMAGSVTTVTAAPASAITGASVTLTATVVAVAPGSGTPTGTVTFSDSINGALGSSPLNASGVATFTATTLTVGSHIITGTYNGDASFTGSAGTAAETTTVAPSTTALTSSANPGVFGQAIVFTATVSPGAGANGVPTGSVTFTVDGASQPVVALVNGVATLTVSNLAINANGHPITASYSGSTNFSASNAAPLTETIGQASTATVVTVSPATTNLGQVVTFTSTTTAVAPGVGTPTGTTTFFIDGAAQNPIIDAAGVANFPTASLAPGNHTITATYNGDTNFKASTSASITFLVSNRAPVANSQSLGTPQNVPLAITLSGSDPDNNPITVFTIATQPANGTVAGSNSVVTYTPNLGFSGTDSFTFTVSDGFQFSQPATITIVVAPPPIFQSPPAITPNPVVSGQTITFTATAVDAAGAPASVSWQFGDGSTATGTTVTHTYTQPGQYTVTVTAVSAAGVPLTVQQDVFVGFGISSGTSNSTIIVGANGLGKAQHSAGLLSLSYTKKSRTSFTGSLGTIKFPSAITQASLEGQAGTLTIGTGVLAQAYSFTLNSKGKGSATGLTSVKVELSKQSISFKASGRAELADLMISLGATFNPGSTTTLLVPVTLRVGNLVFVGVTYKLQYKQTRTTGKGSTL